MKLAGDYYLENDKVVLKSSNCNKIILNKEQVWAVELLIKHYLGK